MFLYLLLNFIKLIGLAYLLYFKYKKEIYNKDIVSNYDYDDNIDTIMLKSTMGTGKTKSLKNLFEKYTKNFFSWKIWLYNKYE